MDHQVNPLEAQGDRLKLSYLGPVMRRSTGNPSLVTNCLATIQIYNGTPPPHPKCTYDSMLMLWWLGLLHGHIVTFQTCYNPPAFTAISKLGFAKSRFTSGFQQLLPSEYHGVYLMTEVHLTTMAIHFISTRKKGHKIRLVRQWPDQWPALWLLSQGLHGKGGRKTKRTTSSRMNSLNYSSDEHTIERLEGLGYAQIIMDKSNYVITKSQQQLDGM